MCVRQLLKSQISEEEKEGSELLSDGFQIAKLQKVRGVVRWTLIIRS